MKSTAIHTLARITLGALFLLSGLAKFQMGIEHFAQFIETVFPLGFMASPLAVFEIVAGCMIVIGLKTRLIALLLAIFCLFTGVFYHQGMSEFFNLLKNIALMGAYFLLYLYGSGPWAIDKDE